MLLLNRVLTVAPGKPASHRGKGWEEVTEQAIRALVARGKPMVAILWGRDARNLRADARRACRPSSRPTPPAVGPQRLLRLPPVQPRQRASQQQGAAPVEWKLLGNRTLRGH